MEALISGVTTILKYAATALTFLGSSIIVYFLLDWLRMHFRRKTAYEFAAKKGNTAEGVLITAHPDLAGPGDYPYGCHPSGEYRYEVDGCSYYINCQFINQEYPPDYIRVYWAGDNPAFGNSPDAHGFFDKPFAVFQLVLALYPFYLARSVAIALGILG